LAYDDEAYDEDEADAVDPEQSEADEELLALARDQFDEITMACQEERALALRDRRFATIAGAQWEGNWQQQFQNSIMVEVNKTAQGVEKIIADYRSNRMIVDFRAVDKDASEQTAETLNGMFRADFYRSNGQQATDCAFEEAVLGGIGAWRLTNKYEDDYDPENDYQRICLEAIPDADQSVFWDPNAKLYDKSDAKYCFVITAMAQEAFAKQYGEDRICDWPQEILKVYYDWYTPDIVTVARYYWYEDKPGLLRIFKNKASGEEKRIWASDLGKSEWTQMLIDGWAQDRTRKAKRRQVMSCVMSGCEVLEKAVKIAGTEIPVVPVYGKRWFIDNMERSRGHVRMAVDPQRIYNGQISKLVETVAVSPIERPIYTPEQVAGREQGLAEANINRSPYDLINPLLNPDGQSFAALGPVGYNKPPSLAPNLAALIQISSNDIGELTNAGDGADEAKANISAEAMDIAATRTDAKTFTYMDNMRQSMQRCGEIWLGMARDIYVEDGREVETMDESGADGTATLAEPFMDEQGQFQIRNDLAAGKYKVISDVTEATTTRRDKTVKTLVNIGTITAPVDPNLSSLCFSTAIINMDGEGMTDLQEYIRAKLVQEGAVKPNEQEKKQIEAAQQQPQPPDPATVLAQAEAALKGAQAQKAQADAGKSVADTTLSRAKAVETLAQAGHASALAGKARAETHGAHADTAATLVPPPTPSTSAVGGFDSSVPATTAKRLGIFDRIRGMLEGQSA